MCRVKIEVTSARREVVYLNLANEFCVIEWNRRFEATPEKQELVVKGYK